MFERVGPRALKLVKHTNTRKKEKKKQSLYLLLVLVLEMILINYLFKNLYIFTIGTKNLVHVPYATVYMKLCSMHSSLENVCAYLLVPLSSARTFSVFPQDLFCCCWLLGNWTALYSKSSLIALTIQFPYICIHHVLPISYHPLLCIYPFVHHTHRRGFLPIYLIYI